MAGLGCAVQGAGFRVENGLFFKKKICLVIKMYRESPP